MKIIYISLLFKVTSEPNSILIQIQANIRIAP